MKIFQTRDKMKKIILAIGFVLLLTYSWDVKIALSAWTPSDLFPGNGAYYDISDISTLYQDAAGTTPVTADGEPVGRVDDLSGNGFHIIQSTPGDRPIYKTNGSLHWLSFAGSEYLANASMIFTQPSSSSYTYEWNNTNNGVFIDSADSAASGEWCHFLTASGLDTRSPTSVIISEAKNADPHVVVFQNDSVSANSDISWDGVLNKSNRNLGVGVLTGITIGAFADGSVGYTGKFFAAVFLDRRVKLSEQPNLENWLASKSGATVTSFDLTDKPIDIFLVGGQSNAQGQGDSSTSPTVATNAAFLWDQTPGELVQLQDPVGDNSLGGEIANDGSAWPSFANKWIELTGRRPMFAYHAKGATTQVEEADIALNGTWDINDATPLTDDAVTKINALMAYLTSEGLEYTLRGVLWSQGETDAIRIDDATITKAQYKTELDSMISDFSTNITGTPSFYIFRTGTLEAGDTSGFVDVRAAQDEVAVVRSDTTIVFDNAVNYPAEGKMADSLHYTQAGYNEMGETGAISINPSIKKSLRILCIGCQPGFGINTGFLRIGN